MRGLHAYWIVFAVTLILVTPIFESHAQKFGKITDEDKQVVAPVDYPEANAVVVFNNGEIKVDRELVEIKRHVRIKVLTEAGIDEIGELSFIYHDDLDRLKDFKAQTILPDGKKIKVEKDAIFTREVGRFKQQVFTFPQITPGCFLEYEFKIYSDRFYYLRPWYFQGELYTLKSNLVVEIPSGFQYDVQYQNIRGHLQEPKREERPDINFPMHFQAKIVTYTWNLENLLPITDEPYMSAKEDYESSVKFQLVRYESPGVLLQFVKSWAEVGKDFDDDVNNYCNKDGDVRKLTEQVTAGLSTPFEKSEAIYKYVSENYESISSPGYYFKNDKMGKLLEEKVGSSAEKNVLMVEMHRAAGIDSWPTLISTRSNARFHPRSPTLLDFNYLICVVQFANGWEFLDASDRISPYGLLPPECLADGGLLIDGDQSSLIRMTIKAINSGRTDRTKIFVQPDGSVKCETVSESTGYYASYMGERLSRKSDKEFIDDHFISPLSGNFVVNDYECKLDSNDNFVASFSFESSDLCELLGEDMVVHPVVFRYKSNPFKREKRFFPVDFMYPFVYKSIVEIYPADSGFSFQTPENFVRDIDGAQVRRSTIMQDSCVVTSMMLSVLEPEFKPGRYADLRSLFDELAIRNTDEIIMMATTEQ